MMLNTYYQPNQDIIKDTLDSSSFVGSLFNFLDSESVILPLDASFEKTMSLKRLIKYYTYHT